MARTLTVLAITLMLTACSDGEDDTAVGGLTAGESEQLERAAVRIDAREPSPAEGRAEALEAEIRSRLDEERRAVERR